jgi:hypothetical protein
MHARASLETLTALPTTAVIGVPNSELYTNLKLDLFAMKMPALFKKRISALA